MIDFKRCGSLIEKRLLDCILKGYPPNDIHQQYHVGKYRMDFFTTDGVGWELDSKMWHNEDYDRERDRWILKNSDIRKIIRVPASALMYYRDATMAVIGHFVKRMDSAKIYCQRDPETAIKEADYLVSGNVELGYEEIYQFEMGEAFNVNNGVGEVGSPLAFIPSTHEIWTHIPPNRVGINKWRGAIVSKCPNFERG